MAFPERSTIIWLIIAGIVVLALLFAPVGSRTNSVSIEPTDSALTAKLGITDSDWRAIEALSANQQGMLILAVRKVGPNLIEVDMKKPEDRGNDQGGPSLRYEKRDGLWAKQANFNGMWLTAHG